MKKSVLTQNKGCCLEPSCHAELVSASRRCNKAVLGAVSHDNKYGFTMVEILVAVLIIAVLVIVAVPQYQKSILKSRFSSLMPPTRAVRDGQEAYYLQHSRYATQMSDLDVKAAQTGGMDISFDDGTNTDFKYVFASRPALHNNLIMYQKQSPKFAGHTHCEALKSDGNANWLCSTALHGQSIEGSISGSDYNTYILEGTQGENDFFLKECPSEGNVTTQPCPSGCGTYDVTASCDTKTGNWIYEGTPTGECLTAPASSMSCATLSPLWTGGTATRSVSCQQNSWNKSTNWNTDSCTGAVNQYYASNYIKAKESAQAWAAELEDYYNQYGHYPTQKMERHYNGTGIGCWAPDGNNDVVYCCIGKQSGSGCAGGVGVGLTHSSYAGGVGGMHCYANISDFYHVCQAETGSGVSGRNYY